MDLHERFDEWLVAGAEGDPPRDLAVHASSCGACLRSVAALDSIQAIEIGDAPLPPLRTFAGRPDRLQRVLRHAAGAAAVVVLGTSVAIGAPALFRSADPVSSPAPTTGEGVLAGLPSERAASEPATQTETPSPTETSSPSASERASVAPEATSVPTRAPIPQPPATPRPTTAPPTTNPTPTATPIVTPSPAPTASPSPEPTASPSPEPTPSPVPAACSNGIDDDGDTLIDFALIGGDPGCTSPDDDSEEELAP